MPETLSRADFLATANTVAQTVIGLFFAPVVAYGVAAGLPLVEAAPWVLIGAMVAVIVWVVVSQRVRNRIAAAKPL